MNPTPVIDMFSGTGELARWLSEEHRYCTTVSSGGVWEVGALGLSFSAQRRLAGNAVVRLQARLMLQRGLIAINNERNL